MRSVEIDAVRLATGLRFVCIDCGGLSVEALEPCAADRLVCCGRCNAVRGTIQGLQEIGRRGLGGIRLVEASFAHAIEPSRYQLTAP